MTTTLTIQNSDKTLIDALKSVIKLHPKAKVSVKSKNDDFYNEANIRHLEEQKRRIEAGEAHFVTKTIEELETMASKKIIPNQEPRNAKFL